MRTNIMIAKKNKGGQVYIIAVIITIVFALVSSFILIGFVSSEKTTDEYIGVYQSGMIDAIIEGDKLLIYVQQAAKYIADKSLQDTADNGFVQLSAESGEDNPGPKCKNYVYNLWNTESKECFPHIENGLGYYFDRSLNEKLSTYDDRNMKKTIERKYYFDSNMNKTKISAFAEEQFEIYVFKSKEYKEDAAVQEYINNKQYTSGLTISENFIWPYKNYFHILSCYGSRNYPGGSEPHPGIDIPAPKGTPIYAVAAGKVYSFSDSWGAIYIDHGSGLKTVYGHTIKQYVKVGDTVKQGQHIADTGGRQYGNDNARGSHLHFEVIQDNIDLRLMYKGIPAIIERNSQKKINPLCMYGKQYFENNKIPLTYEKNFGCTNICNPDKSTCADKSSCDEKYGCLFKFCEAYGVLSPSDVNCQTKDNSDWKITNIQVSQKEVSGDNTIKIITTIENPSAECVSVAARPMFSATGQTTYTVDGKKMTDVYNNNQGKSYVNIETECTFITDKTKLVTERGPDKCVLLAPSDDTKIKYTVKAGAIDAKTRAVTGTKTVTFEVTKPSGIQGQPPRQPTVYPVDDFMKGNYAAVKRNMEKYKVIQSVIKFSQQYNVPSEIILGKMTQESSGIPGVKASDGKGGGLGQTSWNEFNAAWNKPTRDKGCKVENLLKTDPFSVDCQVETAILHLLDKKKMTDDARYYENAVKKSCADPKYQQLYLSYPEKSWERALRAYNGFGCKTIPVGNSVVEPWLYVSKVMGYAGLWGYSGALTQIGMYQQVAKDEIEGKGIIGKYYVNPSFTLDIPFDLSLVDNLSRFMNQTVNECRISQLGKEPCLDSKIAEFNASTGALYKSNGINIELTRDCDESNDEKAFNEFIESVEDCALSPDFDCQCNLKNSSTLRINIDSDDDSALFSFTKSGITKEIKSYNKFLDVNNNPLKLSNSIKDISLYKKLGYLKSGKTNYRTCTVTESRFRLCLKTDYHTEEYDGQSLKKKNVTLKFAITIKDNDPPPPVTNLRLSNMKHSKNSVIVSWDESKKNNQKVPDVASYVIYMSDVAADFNNDINTIRNSVKYRTLDILSTGYEKIQGFDMNQEPECEIVDDKYCIFKYAAKDSSGADIKFELTFDKLYYLIDEERFFYILNGSDPYNSLNNGRDKYIAVTAVDTDGNEIDNVNISQKITLGQNLQTIKPSDNLEPGFVSVTATVNTLTNMIRLTYDAPTFYINGEAMDNVAIAYRAYSDWDCQNQNNPDFCNVKIPFDHISETGALTMEFPKTPLMYRIGVITVIRKNNIEAQYNSGFTETIPVTP